MLVFDLPPRLNGTLVLAAASVLAACGGGGGASDAPASNVQTAKAASRPVEQTDLEIAAAIYSGMRTPQGFQVDAAPSEHAFVATLHLKNTDIDSTLDATAPQFELCTDEWSQALEWSETSAQRAPQYSNLVATNDEARYFEFGRTQPSDPPVYVRARVFKCAYLDRSSANLRAGAGPAGHLNVRPIDADELERLAEYLWQFTGYNNFGHTVLKSAATNGAPLEHTLYIASLVRDGLSSGCDRIDVIAWRHRVDPTSGVATSSVDTLWSFGAREAGGIAQLCTS